MLSLTKDEETLVLEQIKYLQSELISIQQAFLGIISVSVGVYALVLYYAFTATGSGKKIFIILPFLFSLSLYNIIKYTIKMLGIDAYVRHLESLINTAHNKPLFSWQSYFIYANGYSVIGIIPQIPCYILIAATLLYKYVQTIVELRLGLPLASFISILLVIQSFFLILMLYHAATQYHFVKIVCNKNFTSKSYSYFQTNNPHTEQPLYIKKILEKFNNH